MQGKHLLTFFFINSNYDSTQTGGSQLRLDITNSFYFFQKLFTSYYRKAKTMSIYFSQWVCFLFTMIVHYLTYHYNSLLKYLLSTSDICTHLRWKSLFSCTLKSTVNRHEDPCCVPNLYLLAMYSIAS